jgi:hypothetical protein
MTMQYLFSFRLEKLQFSQLICEKYSDTPFDGNDTVDNRAIEFIEEVNIEDDIGIEAGISQ